MREREKHVLVLINNNKQLKMTSFNRKNTHLLAEQVQ